jgi:hypothetical protein
MKVRCMAGLLGVAVAASVAFTQDVTPEINAGTKALLFTFDGLSNLGAGAYNGGIGGKYYLMSPLALRASLAFGASSQDNGEDVYGSSSAMSFGISAGAEYHLGFARVSPYVGGEIGFSTTSTKIEDSTATAKVTLTNMTATPGTNPVLGYVPGNALMVSGIGGVEFFITKELSLSAEYALGWSLPTGYTQKSVTATTTGTTTDEVKVTGRSDFGIFNSGALTLAVYF